MAIIESRFTSIQDGMVEAFVTFDDADDLLDPDIEAYRIVWDIPVGETIRVNIWRITSGRIWRTTDLSGQGEYSDAAPFGPVKKKDDLIFEFVPMEI